MGACACASVHIRVQICSQSRFLMKHITLNLCWNIYILKLTSLSQMWTLLLAAQLLDPLGLHLTLVICRYLVIPCKVNFQIKELLSE